MPRIAEESSRSERMLVTFVTGSSLQRLKKSRRLAKVRRSRVLQIISFFFIYFSVSLANRISITNYLYLHKIVWDGFVNPEKLFHNETSDYSEGGYKLRRQYPPLSVLAGLFV